MKKLILSVLMSLVCIGVYAGKPTDNPYAISHYVIERKVVDMSAFFDSIAAQLGQVVPDCVTLLNQSRFYTPLAGYVGKQLPADNQTLMVAADDIVKYMETSGHPKASKARKDLAKGKLNKECGSVIDEYLRMCDNNAKVAREGLRNLGNMLEEVENKAHNFTVEELALNDGVKLKVIFDTVPNPLFNQHITLDKNILAARDRETQPGEWKWALTDELVGYEQSYPKPLKYHYFKNHPEYAARNGDVGSRQEVFDRNGKLVRVVYFTVDNALTQDGLYDTNTFFYRMAWKANAYNVHSEKPAVTHAIKVRVGIEGKTAAEKAGDRRRDKALSNAVKKSINARIEYGDSWVSDAIERKAVKKYLSTSGGMETPESARNWFRQIESDYEGALAHPYKVERIDDITFKVYYVDENYMSTFEALYKYKEVKPFEYWCFLEDLRAVDNPVSLKDNYEANAVLVDTLPEVVAGSYSPSDNGGERDFTAEYVDSKASCEAEGKNFADYVKAHFVWPSTTVSSAMILAKVVIDRDGTPLWTDLKFLGSYDDDFEAEILRLIKNTGKWQPAYLAGKPVRSRVGLIFNLNYGREPDVQIVGDDYREQKLMDKFRSPNNLSKAQKSGR